MKINITIPAFNEEAILRKSITTLSNFLHKNITHDEWNIIIVDNNSNDNTAKIAKDLSEKFHYIKYLFTHIKGKGIAIKTGWLKFPADIYIFMDADLSTDLEALPNLIKSIKDDGHDIAVGSRFHAQSKVKRNIVRKIISWGYKVIKKILTGSTISDAPCGFKAVNDRVIKEILPKIKNNEWFFDSEILIIAEKQKYKIKEIPVKWEDIREKGDKSKVKVIKLSIEYFRNILELNKRLKNNH